MRWRRAHWGCRHQGAVPGKGRLKSSVRKKAGCVCMRSITQPVALVTHLQELEPDSALNAGRQILQPHCVQGEAAQVQEEGPPPEVAVILVAGGQPGSRRKAGCGPAHPRGQVQHFQAGEGAAQRGHLVCSHIPPGACRAGCVQQQGVQHREGPLPSALPPRSAARGQLAQVWEHTG